MTFETPATKAAATTRVFLAARAVYWGGWFVSPGAMEGRGREG